MNYDLVFGISGMKKAGIEVPNDITNIHDSW